MLGVQWHPEADERSRVIGALVEAAACTAPPGRGARLTAALTRQRDDRVQLDERVARQAGDRERDARRRIGLEERRVDLVDGREVGHVRASRR